LNRVRSARDAEARLGVLRQCLRLVVRQRPHDAEHLAKDCLNGNIFDGQFHAAGLDSGQVQDVVDQCEQVLPAGVDVADVAALAIVQRAVAFLGEQCGEAKNGIKRRAQFVAHRRKELILEPAGALQLSVRLFQFLDPLAADSGELQMGPHTSQEFRAENGFAR